VNPAHAEMLRAAACDAHHTVAVRIVYKKLFHIRHYSVFQPKKQEKRPKKQKIYLTFFG
jgi:hypothetical protein